MIRVAIPRRLFADILHLIGDCRRRLIQRRHERLAYPRAGTKAKGEVRPDEGKIDFPGAQRTVVTDFGAR